MASFRELLCEKLYGGHALTHDKIVQLGYSTESFQWEFIITCYRCNKSSVINRIQLDEIIIKKEDDKNGKREPRPEPPKQDGEDRTDKTP